MLFGVQDLGMAKVILFYEACDGEGLVLTIGSQLNIILGPIRVSRIAWKASTLNSNPKP